MLFRVVVIAMCICCSVQALSETVDPVTADIFLVLKNGAGVRGEFVSLIDGQYTLRLPDGRVMNYAVDDVDRIERVQVTPAESADLDTHKPSTFPSATNSGTLCSRNDSSTGCDMLGPATTQPMVLTSLYVPLHCLVQCLDSSIRGP